MRAIFFPLLLISVFHLQAQDCNETNHSVNIHDSWLSCDLAPNPNPERGNTHWVMYDLGYIYNIGSTKFWNYNVSGETNKGMKNISIDYSQDGINWTESASFQLAEASGNSSYEGATGPDLGGIDARYILVTSVDTWGGDCAGLSEVRFDIEGTVSANTTAYGHQSIKLFPNPSHQNLMIDTDMDIKELIIVSSAGHELVRMAYAPLIDISSLPNGVYFLKSINRANRVYTKRFIKQAP